MSNIAKLKKKALELEQKKQFDKALALYVQIIESSGSTSEEVDVALYNRVGDLMLREGQVGQALSYYESAVDLYAEQGFFNNAIALCNKVLRQNPGRTSIYYKLGKISARKGFISDAKQNFLEYADRMQKSGQLDEAFRALKEFADLCPDQDDIRLMLAEQLTRRERKGEALEQLQTLYDKFSAEGREAEARATIDRMKAIDPTAEPVSSDARPAQKGSDLVFLDVGLDDKGPGGRAGKSAKPAPAAPPRAAPVPAPPPRSAPPPPAAKSAPSLDDLPLIMPDAAESLGASAAAAEPDAPAPMAGLEFTSLGTEGDATPPLTGREFDAIPLDASADRPAVAAPAHDLALPGELPALDGLTPPAADPLAGGVEFDFGLSDGSLLDIGQGSSGAGGELPMLSFGDSDAGAGDGGLTMPLDVNFDSSLDSGAGASSLGGGIEPSTLDFLANADAGSAPLGDLPMLDAGVPPAPPAPAAPLPEGDAAFLAMMSPGTETPTGASLPDTAAIEPATLDYLAHAAPPVSGVPAPAAQTPLQLVQTLRDQAVRRPTDWELRRRYAEALLDAGERDAGLAELEQAMVGLERTGDLDAARSVADEIVRLDPSSVRHHQKRVEYAFRANDKPRLCDAYLELADALFRTGQAEKSRVVYHRVLEINPDDMRARGALSAFVDESDIAAAAAAAAASAGAAPPKPPKSPAGKVPSSARVGAPPSRPAPRAPAAAASAATASFDDSFVNLGDMLRDDDGQKSTRMVVAEEEPSGDEAADFADMLRKFKQGVAENVDDDDHESHYDLGVAYKEMGLVDEAIAEFQKALRAPGRRARTYEALGQCFIEKRQFQVAKTILERALSEPEVSDDQLVGVLYLLGYACEALQQRDEALTHYQRVFAVDIQFRDVTDRLAAVEKVAR